MGRHCLVLDEALDEVVKARLQRARGVSFFGCGMASDESPPSQDRVAGFRFQITYISIARFSKTKVRGSYQSGRQFVGNNTFATSCTVQARTVNQSLA